MNPSSLMIFAFVCFASLACSKEKAINSPDDKPPIVQPENPSGAILSANGTTDTYKLINSVLAGKGDVLETPDCAHPAAGPHITQVFDDFLKKYVFAFHIHKEIDNDRCIATITDRQRNEIKTYGSSPDSLKAAINEKVEYSWKFKLDENFKPSLDFTHLHQIKPIDGDAGMPIITLTARYKSAGDQMEVIHTGGEGKNTSLKYLASVPLSDFKGEWVEVIEKVTFAFEGKYEIVIRRLSDNKELLSIQKDNIDMWRDGTTFCRPKWGIYRSLQPRSLPYIRDETVWFNDFKIQKH